MNPNADRPDRRERGFTLVELLVVMAIVAVLAGVAVSRLSGWTAGEDARKFAREITSTITAARRRAVNSGLTYEVHLKQSNVQWLRKDANGNIVERGPLIEARNSATAVPGGKKPLSIAGVSTADLVAMGQTTTFIGTQTGPTVAFGGTTDWVMTVDASGVIDGNITNNGVDPPPVDGVTIFVDGPHRIRIVVYPLAAQPQIMDNW